MNKNFASNAIGDHYVEQGKAACREKLASKELWVDEAHHGFKYASPQKRCSTPGDAYASVAQKNVEVIRHAGVHYPDERFFTSLSLSLSHTTLGRPFRRWEPIPRAASVRRWTWRI